jgi:two-component system cell cycle response regulator
MGLRLKFNLCLLGILLMGMLVSGIFGYRLLQNNARDEVMQHATLLMETALATRTYTTNQIKPHLDPRLDVEFLPQTVPAFRRDRNPERGAQEVPGIQLQGGGAQPDQPA